MKIDMRKINKEMKQAFFATDIIHVVHMSDSIGQQWYELLCQYKSFTYAFSDSLGRIGFDSDIEALNFFFKRLSRPHFDGVIKVVY